MIDLLTLANPTWRFLDETELISQKIFSQTTKDTSESTKYTTNLQHPS